MRVNTKWKTNGITSLIRELMQKKSYDLDCVFGIIYVTFQAYVLCKVNIEEAKQRISKFKIGNEKLTKETELIYFLILSKYLMNTSIDNIERSKDRLKDIILKNN